MPEAIISAKGTEAPTVRSGRFTNDWFCPNCGQPMEARRHVDNPTGRITWTIGCLNPKHFHTRGYMNAAIAEIQLEKLLHH